MMSKEEKLDALELIADVLKHASEDLAHRLSRKSTALVLSTPTLRRLRDLAEEASDLQAVVELLISEEQDRPE